MKIAILHDYFDKRGGGERLVLNLARALKADIYTGFIEREKTFDISGIKIVRLGVSPRGNALLRGRKIEKAFSKLSIKYDFYIFSGVWCISAAKNHHPNIIYLHTIPRFAYDLKTKYLESVDPIRRVFLKHFIDKLDFKFRNSLPDFDAICTNSENVKNRTSRYIEREYKNIVTVYTGFDTKRFCNKKEEGFYLSTSRLDELKRIDLIIEAFKKNNKKLIIASTGPDEKRLKKAANGYDNIKFFGRVEEKELLDLYARCKAVIIAAVDEDLGLVPLEAHASGKPVIAVKEGGFLETVKEGKTGIFFEPNVNSLINALEKLENTKWDKNYIMKTSKKYDISNFVKNMRDIIDFINHEYKRERKNEAG